MTSNSLSYVNITKTILNDKITEVCKVCGKSLTQPNKGLGRANLASWRTRHQHLEERRDA